MRPERPMPPWEGLLASASTLQDLVPGAVLVGGTAAAVHAAHRLSRDADHVVPDLRTRFDAVLADLEAVAGWRTARVVKPVLILGALHGVETGIRQLRREAPLETQSLTLSTGATVIVPTGAEMLRVKAWLLATRNTTRDLLDVVALVDTLGTDASVAALATLDELYPQGPAASVLQQVMQQLASPDPDDFDPERPLADQYRGLAPAYHEWPIVTARAGAFAATLLAGLQRPRSVARAHGAPARASEGSAAPPLGPSA